MKFSTFILLAAPCMASKSSSLFAQTDAPTSDCTCWSCICTCTIQPGMCMCLRYKESGLVLSSVHSQILLWTDPHCRVWDNSCCNFQGGWDQHAIKNDVIEVQIATRPRDGHSTIAQISVVMKQQTDEFFKIKLGQPLQESDNTIATNATVTQISHQSDRCSSLWQLQQSFHHIWGANTASSTFSSSSSL